MSIRGRSDGQEGTALIMSLLVSFVMFGIAGAYMTLSAGGFEGSSVEQATVQARLGAEDGIHLSIAELKSGVDANGDGLGTLTSTAADGRTITVTATDLGNNLFQIHSVAVLRRARSGADVVAEMVPLGGISFAPKAAITAEGPVATLGNITVDGRDWNINGTALVGPGKYGISSMGSITNSGNSKVGGNGIPPSKPPLPGSQDPFSDWSNGNDDDGDGAIDEDTKDYPSTPDVSLGLPEGTLKNSAIATGSYFGSVAAFDAWVAANSGVVPGGKIIYCDFALWEPVVLGNAFNSPPSIIVHHTANGMAQMKNVHGMFKGLVLADFVVHLNGDFVILGALMSFGDDSMGNAFGNGAAFVKLCTAALANLPAPAGASAAKIRAWNRAVAQ
jgi:hypothetical protein